MELQLDCTSRKYLKGPRSFKANCRREIKEMIRLTLVLVTKIAST